MCIRVAIIWWLLFLLLPGVTGRALAQGGRFTPQQEAWMRHIFLEWVTANSNAVASMYSRTNTWNGTATWVGSHSNAVQSMEGRTSTWNTASSWVGSHSNSVQYMESQTNLWDQALTNVYSSGSNNWNFSKVGLRAWLEYSTNADTISGHPWADILALTNSGATTNWVDLYYYPRSNPSNWVTASVTNGLYPASNPSNWVDQTVTNGLYPASNPSNWVTASVTNGLYPASNPSNWVDQTVTNGLWAYVGGTNWVDLYYYPRSNPSNWVDQTVTNGLWGYVSGTNWVSANFYSDLTVGYGLGSLGSPPGTYTGKGISVYIDPTFTNWVDATYYPRSNPSNWVDQTVTNGLPSLAGNQTWTGTNAFSSVVTVIDASNVTEAVNLQTLTRALGTLSVLYASTNMDLGVTNASGTAYYDARTFMPTHTSATITVTGVTNNQYLASWASNTNLVSELRAGIAAITARMRTTSPIGARVLIVKPEIYLLSGALAEPELFETSQQVTLTGTMTDYTTAINCPTNVVVPATSRLVVKWKAVTATGSPNWYFECGTPNVIACRLPTTAAGGAAYVDLGTPQTITGQKTFSQTILGTVSNAQYLGGVAAASYATNAGAAGGDAYVMSNGGWVARGSATGDVAKVYVDANDTAISNRCLAVADVIIFELLLADYRAALEESTGLRTTAPIYSDHFVNTNGVLVATNTAYASYYANLYNSFLAGGGTQTTIGESNIWTFTSSGTFTVTNGGLVDLLVVGGGGAGGPYNGGGGGGGEVIVSNAYSLTSGVYSVVVGDGGASSRGGGVWNAWANTAPGDTGGVTVVNGVIAKGGGRGGSDVTTVGDGTGGNGACGGGGGGGTGATTGGTGSPGYNGGVAYHDSSYSAGGGGGGMSAVGVAASYLTGGNGGAGTASSVAGSSVYYGAGGGGGVNDGSGTPGAGGSGVGGAGSKTGNGGTATANTGSGGGGAFGGSPAGHYSGAGATGIVAFASYTATPVNGSVTSVALAQTQPVTTARVWLYHRTISGTLGTNLQMQVGTYGSVLSNVSNLAFHQARAPDNIYTGSVTFASSTNLQYRVMMLAPDGTNASQRLYGVGLWTGN